VRQSCGWRVYVDTVQKRPCLSCQAAAAPLLFCVQVISRSFILQLMKHLSAGMAPVQKNKSSWPAADTSVMTHAPGPSARRSNHHNIWRDARVEEVVYPYYNPDIKGLDFERLCDALDAAPKVSVVLLHACAHNPTGGRRAGWGHCSTYAAAKWGCWDPGGRL
jgi:hypothetical protein